LASEFERGDVVNKRANPWIRAQLPKESPRPVRAHVVEVGCEQMQNSNGRVPSFQIFAPSASCMHARKDKLSLIIVVVTDNGQP